MSPITVALAGNPNSGKTAVFNALTGSQQRVGNWPGVTVEKKMGKFQWQKSRVTVVDLPGIYSLTAGSAIDETIAMQYLQSYEADVIVNIIDGSNLERNLYLTLQLIEMKIPVIIAINMMDIVKERGLNINLKKLQEKLNCPVIELIASKNIGINKLKQAVIQQSQEKKISSFKLFFPIEIENARKEINQKLSFANNQDWLSLHLLENNGLVTNYNDIQNEFIQNEIHKIREILSEDPDILIADARYQYINQLALSILTRTTPLKKNFTERLDKIVLNRWLGIPIFLLIMYCMFLFAINIGGAFQDFFDISSNAIFVDGATHLFSAWNFPPGLIAILANGVGKGINTTITFIPILAGMFLFLAFLEDSGYMARAAFVMDRLMGKLGLPGKSFVPMIVGFGCNVPAVLGARTLENPRDRILTVMMMPFMSCGARLAIFAVFASAFFPKGGQNIIFILYLTGILAAILTGLLLRKTKLPGEPAPLVMELPPYHAPRLTVLSRQMWLRLKSFIFRAGKLIIPICMLLGILNAITINGKIVESNSRSLLAETGQLITPIFKPMGITENNWPATMGLVTGVLAKEVVVGTLNSLYSEVGHLTQKSESHEGIGSELKTAILSIPQNLSGLTDAFKNPIVAAEAPHEMNLAVYGLMSRYFDGKVGAFAYLLFILLYFPCISTLAVMRKEIGNRWANFSMIWSTVLAYAAAVSAYQLLTITHHPLSSMLWVIGMVFLISCIIWKINQKNEQMVTLKN